MLHGIAHCIFKNFHLIEKISKYNELNIFSFIYLFQKYLRNLYVIRINRKHIMYCIHKYVRMYLNLGEIGKCTFESWIRKIQCTSGNLVMKLHRNSVRQMALMHCLESLLCIIRTLPSIY